MRIVLLAPPGVQALDVVGPAEVFWEAARRLGDPKAYEVQVMGTAEGPVCGSGSLRFLADRSIHDPDQPIDTLLIAGDPSFKAVDPAVIDWLRRRAPQARRYGSICTGVFLLAATGLLDGRRVTTHWECADKLRADFPALTVDPDQIFIRDGKVCTAAGVTSGIDLALSLLEEDHGRDLALLVARYMVMFLKRPGGQSQFSAHLAAQASSRTGIQKIQEHVLDNLSADLSVDALAAHAGMSPRNFARVFKRDVGRPPAEFVEAARLDAARRMLVDSSTPLQRIAYICGFGDAGTMRRAFVRTLGTNPADYRKRFRTTTAS